MTPTEEIERLKDMLGNTSMLLVRMSRRLPKDDKVRQKALDYLTRIGWIPSMLRDALPGDETPIDVLPTNELGRKIHEAAELLRERGLLLYASYCDDAANELRRRV